MKPKRGEWMRQATLEVLVREAPGIIDRARCAANLVELIDLVAQELDKKGVFDEE